MLKSLNQFYRLNFQDINAYIFTCKIDYNYYTILIVLSFYIMELVVDPDIYSPSIDEHGNYVDRIPPAHIVNRGLLCPCGCRKAKVYDKHAVFSTHIKTKAHQSWLVSLNHNKANYYVENERAKTTIQNQQLIIARMEKELQAKSMTIDYLSQQLIRATSTLTNTATTDLLDFD